MVQAAQPTTLEVPYAFRPVFLARYVLEANAGFVREHKINIGDQARFRWIF
jgi:uncharacterized membrane protein (UPF0127 family)